MKLLHLKKFHFALITYKLVFILATAEENNYGHQKVKYFADPDYRFYTQYYRYSNTEFDHAIDDDRCLGRPSTSREIVKETQYGNVRGRVVYLCDRPGLELRKRPGQPNAYGYQYSVRVFLGIPYADPPVRRRNADNLQFKPPHGDPRFGDVDAFHYKPACPQHNKYFSRGQGINTTSEDCLYLNIFSPAQTVYDSPVQELYAVMFHIHDGNFDHGSGSLFPGHMLAASQKVVVVTFNYRLGPLGFLATGDTKSPGNYGMLDQVKALKWVYENIHVFDGDPKRITVFGSGAGGASAALLALSPLSRRIIKRVIAQNGSPLADWAAINDIRFMQNTTEIVGEGLGCSQRDASLLVECVGTRLNEIKILKIKPRIGWLPWAPVVDNVTRSSSEQFLPESPKDMLERGIIFPKDFAFMTGVNRDQGSFIFMEDVLTTVDLEVNSGTFDKKIRDFMKMYNYSVNAEGIFDAIKFMYKPPFDSLNRTLLRESYIHLLTDRYYISPMETMVQLMVKNKVPTYAYVLNYTLKGYTTILKDFVGPEVEYLLLTGAPFMDPKFFPHHFDLKRAKWTEDDRNMSQCLMQAFANFAKEGEPTRTRLFNTIMWEKVEENYLRYLNLNATDTNSEMIYNYRERESRFWNSFLPFFIDREPPTLAPTLEPGVAELRVLTSALWGSVSIACILIVITLVCCSLYCRIRSFNVVFLGGWEIFLTLMHASSDGYKNPVDDLDSSREVIVNHSVAHQDTPV